MLRIWNRLIGWLTNQHPTTQGRKAAPSRAPYRLQLESLEDRVVPTSATFNGVVADFNGLGLHRFTEAQGMQQLTPFDPNQVLVADNGDIVADFSGAGLFRFSDATGWQRLTPVDPTQLG